MDKIMQFFDFNKPCPPEITDCDQHRAQFIRDLNDLKMRGGCGTCIEKQLRHRYMAMLQSHLKQV